MIITGHHVAQRIKKIKSVNKGPFIYEKEIINDRKFLNHYTIYEFIDHELKVKPYINKKEIVDVLIKHGYLKNAQLGNINMPSYSDTINKYTELKKFNE